jgi:hypothetical protein
MGKLKIIGNILLHALIFSFIFKLTFPIFAWIYLLFIIVIKIIKASRKK